MLPPMSKRREPKRIEFLTSDGYKLEYDADGWRLLQSRNLGPKALDRARAVLAKAEECLPPVDPERLVPPDMLEIGEYVAKQLNLRITHRDFRHR